MDALGPFDQEPCGALFRCAHKVDKFFMKNGEKQHVQIFYCSVNWAIVGGGLFILFVLFLFMRMKASKASSVAGMASSITS